jgi:signal transduction histidine kinase
MLKPLQWRHRRRSTMIEHLEAPAAPTLPTGFSPCITAVVAYAAFGSLWILGSDHLLDLIAPDRAALLRLETYKGWFFVAITSLLLFRLLHQRTALQVKRSNSAELKRLVALRTAELEQANAELVLAWDGLEARNVALQVSVEEHTRTEIALQRAMAELEAFSYTVSHDLRAPLAAIHSFADAVMQTEADVLSERGRHRLGRIAAGAQRMEQMIQDILACSRVESTEMRCREVDLNALAAEVVAEAGPLWPGPTVTVGPLPDVRGDANMLRQVLSNLVRNALKFSATRPDARVEVTAGKTEAGTEIRVRDNGAGFDQAYAGKLFGLFQRLHSDAEFAGTGVGLAIVKRLVQRHGGEVCAESVPGGWTTFSFTLGEFCSLEGCKGCDRSGQVH